MLGCRCRSQYRDRELRAADALATTEAEERRRIEGARERGEMQSRSSRDMGKAVARERD
jgi:hypothetical protein